MVNQPDSPKSNYEYQVTYIAEYVPEAELTLSESVAEAKAEFPGQYKGVNKNDEPYHFYFKLSGEVSASGKGEAEEMAKADAPIPGDADTWLHEVYVEES